MLVLECFADEAEANQHDDSSHQPRKSRDPSALQRSLRSCERLDQALCKGVQARGGSRLLLRAELCELCEGIAEQLGAQALGLPWAAGRAVEQFAVGLRPERRERVRIARSRTRLSGHSSVRRDLLRTGSGLSQGQKRPVNRLTRELTGDRIGARKGQRIERAKGALRKQRRQLRAADEYRTTG